MAPGRPDVGPMTAQGLTDLVTDQGAGHRTTCLFFRQHQAQSPARGARTGQSECTLIHTQRCLQPLVCGQRGWTSERIRLGPCRSSIRSTHQRQRMQDEMRRARNRARTQRPLKISSFQAGWPHGVSQRSSRNKAGQGPGLVHTCTGQTPSRHRPDRGGKLQTQTLAALGATVGDDLAATLGLHAHQKAMGAGATGLGGLVSTLHDGLSRPRTKG